MKKKQFDYMRTTGHLSPNGDKSANLFGTKTMTNFQSKKTKLNKPRKVTKNDAIFIPEPYDTGS